MSAFNKALFGVNCKAVAKEKVGNGETNTVSLTGILSSDKEEFVQACHENLPTLSKSIKDGDNRTRTYTNKEPVRSEAVDAAREVLGLPVPSPKKSKPADTVKAAN